MKKASKRKLEVRTLLFCTRTIMSYMAKTIGSIFSFVDSSSCANMGSVKVTVDDLVPARLSTSGSGRGGRFLALLAIGRSIGLLRVCFRFVMKVSSGLFWYNQLKSMARYTTTTAETYQNLLGSFFLSSFLVVVGPHICPDFVSHDRCLAGIACRTRSQSDQSRSGTIGFLLTCT